MGQYELIIKMMNERFDRLENKVDQLQTHKWKGIGFSAGVVSIFSILGFAIQIILGK